MWDHKSFPGAASRPEVDVPLYHPEDPSESDAPGELRPADTTEKTPAEVFLLYLGLLLLSVILVYASQKLVYLAIERPFVFAAVCALLFVAIGSSYLQVISDRSLTVATLAVLACLAATFSGFFASYPGLLYLVLFLPGIATVIWATSFVIEHRFDWLIHGVRPISREAYRVLWRNRWRDLSEEDLAEFSPNEVWHAVEAATAGMSQERRDEEYHRYISVHSFSTRPIVCAFADYRERLLYLALAFLFLAAVYVPVAFLVPFPPTASFFLLLLGFLAISAFAYVLGGGMSEVNREAFAQTMRHWLGWRSKHENYPSVYEGRFRGWGARLAVTFAVFFVAAATLLPMAYYFSAQPGAIRYLTEVEQLKHAIDHSSYARTLEELRTDLTQRSDAIVMELWDSLDYQHHVRSVHGPLTLLIAFFLSLAIPGLLVTSLYYALVAPLAAVLHEHVIQELPTTHGDADPEGDSSPERPEPTLEGHELVCSLVDSLQTSSNPRHRNNLYLGHMLKEDGSRGEEVFIHRESLHNHALIRGATGRGKTSLGFSLLIWQLAQMLGRELRNPETEPFSIIVVDLKGDDYLFNLCRWIANKEEIPFRWFSAKTQDSTFAYNPLWQAAYAQVPLTDRAGLLTRSLGAEYGRGYGEKYFSDTNKSLLQTLLTECPKATTFWELEEELGKIVRDPKAAEEERGIPRSLLRDAIHLHAILKQLAAIGPFNISPKCRRGMPRAVADHAIDATDIVTRPQMVYFKLRRGALGSTTTEIASTSILASLLTAVEVLQGNERLLKGRKLARTYIFLDEGQEIYAEGLRKFLETARDRDLPVILGCHALSQFGVQYAELLDGMTSFQQVFSAAGLQEIQRVINNSGTTLRPEFAYELDGAVTTVREKEAPRITQNILKDLDKHPNRSFARLATPSKQNLTSTDRLDGFERLIQCDYFVSKERYEQLRGKKSIEPAPGTFIPDNRPDLFKYKSSKQRSKPPRGPKGGKKKPPPDTDPVSAVGTPLQEPAPTKPPKDDKISETLEELRDDED